MSTYWSILEKMRGSQLRLTKIDDKIYEHLKKDFPEFNPRDTIDEDKMKSKEGKERWRNFMMAYEKKVDDYNFGTMLRANPKFEYGEKETIFGLWLVFILQCGRTDRLSQRCGCSSTQLRLQGTCSISTLRGLDLIGTRNREGLNDWIYEREHPNEATAKAS